MKRSPSDWLPWKHRERLWREGKLRLEEEYAAWRDEDTWSAFVARLLDAAEVPLSDEADRFEPSDWESREKDQCRCPRRGGKLQLVMAETRRSWRDMLNSPAAPSW